MFKNIQENEYYKKLKEFIFEPSFLKKAEHELLLNRPYLHGTHSLSYIYRALLWIPFYIPAMFLFEVEGFLYFVLFSYFLNTGIYLVRNFISDAKDSIEMQNTLVLVLSVFFSLSFALLSGFLFVFLKSFLIDNGTVQYEFLSFISFDGETFLLSWKSFMNVFFLLNPFICGLILVSSRIKYSNHSGVRVTSITTFITINVVLSAYMIILTMDAQKYNSSYYIVGIVFLFFLTVGFNFLKRYSSVAVLGNSLLLIWSSPAILLSYVELFHRDLEKLIYVCLLSVLTTFIVQVLLARLLERQKYLPRKN
ncbi:MAG: hypothetical protein H7A25_26515 [Leptospiraceae bacterium]|nr:hypothetical protein [Leptospiraceae bacterium]